jgi:hypothetical protein
LAILCPNPLRYRAKRGIMTPRQSFLYLPQTRAHNGNSGLPENRINATLIGA